MGDEDGSGQAFLSGGETGSENFMAVTANSGAEVKGKRGPGWPSEASQGAAAVILGRDSEGQENGHGWRGEGKGETRGK